MKEGGGGRSGTDIVIIVIVGINKIFNHFYDKFISHSY